MQEINPSSIHIIRDGSDVKKYDLIYEMQGANIRPGSNYCIKFHCDNPVDTEISMLIVGYTYNHRQVDKTFDKSFSLKIDRHIDDYEIMLDIPKYEGVNRMEKLLISIDHDIGVSSIMVEEAIK